MKNRLGVHIRLYRSLHSLLERADLLDLPFFQCFFLMQESGKLLVSTHQEVKDFLCIRREKFNELFCHLSYWVNLANTTKNGYPQLKREVTIAKRLEFTHLVLHAGTAIGALHKSEGIDTLARALNTIFRYEQDLIVLLENTCHAKAIGSDLFDFKMLLERLDRPEMIGFCIDTAHAYSFGYNISHVGGRDAFIDLIDATIGIDRVKLIHLNDTDELLGSYLDRHAIMGQGKIGVDALKSLATHSRLQHILLLMELPEMSVEQELAIINDVRDW